MPTPFAALEERVNLACAAHLANAEATWQAAGGGATVDASVILPTPYFERTEAGTLSVIEYVRVLTSVWPLAVAGDEVTIDGAEYRIRTIEPERATGLKRVNLVKV